MKKKITRRQFLAATATVGVGAALASCSSDTTSSSSSSSSSSSASSSTTTSSDVKTLRLGWTADMQTMDIHKTSSNYTIPMNIFGRLLEIQLNDDGTTELVNSMASDYTLSDDGLTYSFTLRDDIYTSAGELYTAYDVEYTYTRMLSLPESVQTDFASAIVGADELIEGTVDTLAGFEVVDDTHFNITLQVPFAGFIYQVATASCCMLSKSVVEAAGDKFGLDAALTIGTGPYVITSWSANSEIVLEANPYYWDVQPDVQKVIYSIVPDSSTLSMMFQNGELDILDCDSIDSSVVEATYKTDYADQMLSANCLSITYMALNAALTPTDDVVVRKAIQMSIDRQSILDAVYAGDGSLEDGIFPKGLIGYSADNQGWLSYDPEAAKAMLAEEGYAEGDIVLELSCDASTSSVPLVLQIMQENLLLAGITTEIKSYDEASWLALRNSGEMPSFVATWTADYNDPDNFIYTFFGNESKTGIRSLNYQDAAVMQRVEDARGIVDDDERLAEYTALERQIIIDDASWVPLWNGSHMFVLGDNVESFIPHWAGYSAFSCTGVTLKA